MFSKRTKNKTTSLFFFLALASLVSLADVFEKTNKTTSVYRLDEVWL